MKMKKREFSHVRTRDQSFHECFRASQVVIFGKVNAHLRKGVDLS